MNFAVGLLIKIMNFIEFYFILVTFDSVSETSVSGEVIVNSVHSVIIVWIRLHAINC